MRRAIALMCLMAAFFLAGCDAVNDKAQEAIDAKDPALCKQLPDENDVKGCYKKVADGLNDPEICFQSAERDDCITYFSLEKRNIKYCDMTTDAVAKYACVAQVTGDNTGRAIEQIIADWRSSGAVSKCKELCQPAYQECMGKHWGSYQEELKRCAGIGDANERFFCENGAEKEMNRNRLECYDGKDECEEGCMPKEG